MDLAPLPFATVLRCWVALALFLAGWAGCFLASLRWLRRPALAEAVAVGYLLWKSCIVFSAVALVAVGWFTPTRFVVASAGFALAAFAWGGEHGLRRQTRIGCRMLLRAPLAWVGIAPAMLVLGAIAVLTWQGPTDSWDTYQYHRGISLMVLQEGRLSGLGIPYFVYDHYPKNGSLVAAWMLAVAGWETPARLIPIFETLVAVLAVGGMLRAWRVRFGLAWLLAPSALVVPAVLDLALRHPGYVDLNVAAVTLVGLLGALRTEREPWKANRWAAVAMLAAAYVIGIKPSCLLNAGLIAGLALVALWLSGQRWRSLTRTTLLFLAFSLALSSYWLILNFLAERNPFGPIEIRVAGQVLFPGRYEVEGIISAQPPPEMQHPSPLVRLLRSLAAQDLARYLADGKLGGAGWHATYLALPLWPLAAGIALARRRWWRAAVLGGGIALFVAVPGSWHLRYSFFLFFASPLALAEVFTAFPRRWLWLRWVLVAFWVALAGWTFLQAARAVWALRSFEFRAARQAAHDAGRAYVTPHDAFRAHWEVSSMRDIYRWLADHLQPGETVAMAGDLGFPALLYRPDYRSSARIIDFWDRCLPVDGVDVAVFTRQVPEARELLREGWAEVWHNDQFRIFRRPGLAIAAPPTEPVPPTLEGFPADSRSWETFGAALGRWDQGALESGPLGDDSSAVSVWQSPVYSWPPMETTPTLAIAHFLLSVPAPDGPRVRLRATLGNHERTALLDLRNPYQARLQETLVMTLPPSDQSARLALDAFGGTEPAVLDAVRWEPLWEDLLSKEELVAEIDLRGPQPGWFSDTDGVRAEQTPEGLQLLGADSSGTKAEIRGEWRTRTSLIPAFPEPGTSGKLFRGSFIYRARFFVSSDVGLDARHRVPTFQLRLGDPEAGRESVLVVESANADSYVPVCGSTLAYDVWLLADPFVPLKAAFEVSDVPWSDNDPRIALTLSRIELYSYDLNAPAAFP